LALVAGACGNTDNEKKAAGATSTARSNPKAGGKPLTIIGTDYAFTGVPASVPAGTVLAFKNESTKEVHEIVALRVNDGETRPASVILQLPEAERDKAAEFRGVVVGFPGEEGFAPEGPLTLSQPGRYLLVCSIPTGADPVAYREKAKTAKGPVEIPGGPPHVAKGMSAELKVT